jgi:UDP-2,4-diacetamido-2,4,6-trideoxy-beta-L-gulopyranose hydrolase
MNSFIDHYHELFIHEDQSIRKALVQMDITGRGVLFVTSDDNTFVGTLSDGDLRRTIISKKKIDLVSVLEVCNTHPIVMKQNSDINAKIKSANTKGVKFLPVLNNNNKIVNVIDLNAEKSQVFERFPIFIMAGGFGTRLRPLTENCPKPMLKIGEKPHLENLLNNFRNQGFKKIYISVHYLSEVIKNYFGDGRAWGLDITYVEENTPLNTAGAISLLEESSSEPMIVMNGDILTDLDFSKPLVEHLIRGSSLTLTVCQHTYQVPFGVVTEKDNIVTGITEKPISKFNINAGIYVISRSSRDQLIKNENISMPELIKRLMDNNMKVTTYLLDSIWIDIGHLDDLKKANEILTNNDTP